ncbi:hypothetical protein EPO05_04870 [Patescibacteria group bacterium]|nr:MAG: hypothetical protein EPO05_04870 [Patescibacteria group bacterium]
MKKLMSLLAVMVWVCAFAQNAEAKKRPPRINLQEGQLVLTLPAVVKEGRDLLEPQSFRNQKKTIPVKGSVFFKNEVCEQDSSECPKSAGVRRFRNQSGRYLRYVVGSLPSEDAGTLNFRVSRKILQLDLRKAVITAAPGILWSVNGNTLSFWKTLLPPTPPPPPLPPPPVDPSYHPMLEIFVIGDDEFGDEAQMTILPPVSGGMLVNVLEEDEAGDGRPASVPLSDVFAVVWNGAESGWIDEDPPGGVQAAFNADSISLTVPLHDSGGMVYFLATVDGGTKIFWADFRFIVPHGGVMVDNYDLISY